MSDAIKAPVLKVSVIGASGRMGSTVCRTVEAAADTQLVGRYDLGDDLGDLGGADVVVEFSVPGSAASRSSSARTVAENRPNGSIMTWPAGIRQVATARPPT